MKQEHWLIVIVGLIIFTFVLDSILPPLLVDVPTPYHFLTPEYFLTYPLTTVSIFLKATAIFITPILLLSFAGWSKLTKGIIIFVISAILQLYALQDIVTRTGSVPLEWSIPFTVAGLGLLAVSLIYMIIGVIQRTNQAMEEDKAGDYIVKPKEEKVKPLTR